MSQAKGKGLRWQEGALEDLVQIVEIIYYTVLRREIVVRAIVHGARLFRSSWLRRKD
jgi:hypothetical protein